MKPYYSDNYATIYHGDCREVLPRLDRVDHIITDPPYGEHTHAKQWIGAALTAGGKPRVSTAHKELGFAPITPEIQRRICAEALRLVARWTILFCDLEGIWGWRESFQAAGLDYVRACIWDKVDSAPQFTGDRPASSAEAIICGHRPGKKRWNGGGSRNVFRHAVNAEKGAKPHPSTKPLPLMREIIRLFTDPNEIILDPFMGSGTTLCAGKELGVHSIGVEIDEPYCEVAARRLERIQPSLFAETSEPVSRNLFEAA